MASPAEKLLNDDIVLAAGYLVVVSVRVERQTVVERIRRCFLHC